MKRRGNWIGWWLTALLWAGAAGPLYAGGDASDSPGRFREALHRVFLTPTDREGILPDSVQMEEGDDPVLLYQPFAGKRIQTIRIARLNEAEDEIDQDSTAISGQPPKRLIDRLIRYSTKDSRIINYLLFKEGEPLDVFKVVDTERLLRELDYIHDAWILVEPCDSLPDAVGVTVIVRDVFPFATEIRVHRLRSVGLVFTNKNIRGTGLSLSTGVYLQRSYKQAVGFTAHLGYENFKNTFISPQLFYSDRKNLVSYGLSVKRNFETPDMKYAGHVLVDRNHQTVYGYYKNLLLVQEGEDPFVLRYNDIDVWLARSFPLHARHHAFTVRRNITLGLRTNRLLFEQRPQNLSTLYYPLQNQHSNLLSVTYSEQSYVKSSRIFNYGRTEDIPVGKSLEIVTGRSFDEITARNYIGGGVSAAAFFKHFGYLYGRTDFGGFLRDGEMTQAVLSANLRYFTNLYSLRRVQGRTFLSATYRRAMERITLDYMTLNNSGIDGFVSDSLRGTQRLVVKWESDFFMPWHLKGFQTVFFLFSDAGWLTWRNQSPLSGRTYATAGAGVRIRNERLVFSTIQLRFAYLINPPSFITFEQLSMSDDQRYRARGFEAVAPQILLLNE